MSDRRISISELQRLGVGAIQIGVLREVVPVLLEIAAASLAVDRAREESIALSAKWVEDGGDYEIIEKAHTRIDEAVKARRAALAKVRL